MKRTDFRRHSVFLVACVCLALLSVVLLIVALGEMEFQPLKLVKFTCYYEGSNNPSRTVTVLVKLQDGMNRDEALQVAEAVFNSNATHVVKSVDVGAEGVWVIGFRWGIKTSNYQEPLNHYFNVTINPFSQTISYLSCR